MRQNISSTSAATTLLFSDNHWPFKLSRGLVKWPGGPDSAAVSAGHPEDIFWSGGFISFIAGLWGLSWALGTYQLHGSLGAAEVQGVDALLGPQDQVLLWGTDRTQTDETFSLMRRRILLCNNPTFGGGVLPGGGTVYFKGAAMEDLFKIDLGVWGI